MSSRPRMLPESDGARGAPGLGEMDLDALASRALTAILSQNDDSEELCDAAATLVWSLSASTRRLAERTHGEFTAPIEWTVEQRQDHCLRAIVERVEQIKGILAQSGLQAGALAPIVDLMRETYFARLAEVARGAQGLGGNA